MIDFIFSLINNRSIKTAIESAEGLMGKGSENPQNLEKKMASIVVKDNALTGASYNLDVVEQRLILLAIVEARESGKGINANDPLIVHASSYMEEFQVTKQTAYQALKDACKDLFARQFSYEELSPKGNIVRQTSRWVSQIGYIEAEASVQLIFAPAIVPLITRLEEKFTSYELSQVARLGSKYSMRLYELLIQWKTVGKMTVDLEDLRDKLGLGTTEYKAMCDFKKSVLDLALKQINASTDLKVAYEQHKKGVRVTGFTFRFKKKPTQPKIKARDPNTLDMKLTDAQRHLFAHKLSGLHEVGSEYAKVGESTEDFTRRLADMLLDEAQFRKLHPLLISVGFQPPKKTAL